MFKILRMLEQAFCDENSARKGEKERAKRHHTMYNTIPFNENAPLKQNESIIELCNTLIYFVRAQKSVLIENFSVQKENEDAPRE